MEKVAGFLATIKTQKNLHTLLDKPDFSLIRFRKYMYINKFMLMPLSPIVATVLVSLLFPLKCCFGGHGSRIHTVRYEH